MKILENLENFFKSQKGVKISVCLGLLGLLLILISNCDKDTSQTTTQDLSISTTENYKINLENNLQDLISKVSGAGETKVMVTLSNGEENIYAEEIKQQTNSDGSKEYESNYITISSGSGKSALISSVKTPTVMGVVVLCKGGSKGQVKEDIYNIVSALTNVSSDKIYVGQLE